jgi:asparagine synthase (glutamine-hydrolysing)
MCGILGQVGPNVHVLRDQLDLRRITHRGPDGTGLTSIGTTRLGHVRLSIIDLEGGAQPMSDLEGLTTIVFNGEIYNYQTLKRELESLGRPFMTHSDTEVILQAYLTWGVKGFSRLRGMFAFALHDHRDDTLVLARDPMGIKPVFYLERQTLRGHEFAFSSEIAGIADAFGGSDSLELDMTSVLETLTQRYPVGEHTLYREIKRLEPGTAMVVGPDGAVRRRVEFSSVRDEIEKYRQALLDLGRRSQTDLIADVRSRVEDSVQHHMIADVPVALFLSGGLDSTIVAQLMTDHTQATINAYAIGFEGSSTENSELPYARDAAARAGVALHEILLTPEDFTGLMPKLSGTLNGPFSDHADVALYKLSQFAARDVKVVLSGEGSDEAFGGYPKYIADGLAHRWGWAARPVRNLIGRRGRIGIAADALAEGDEVKRWQRWFSNDSAPVSLVRSLERIGTDPERANRWVRERTSRYPSEWSNLQRMQTLDLEAWMPRNIMHRADYISMQASLEQRVPFLDIELSPWAIALPDSAKIRGTTGKAVLRDAFRDRLPQSVFKRPKSGFRLPLAEWLRQNKTMNALLHDHLESPSARLRDWMPADELRQLASLETLSTSGGAKLAWTALGLELWLGAVARIRQGQATQV